MNVSKFHFRHGWKGDERASCASRPASNPREWRGSEHSDTGVFVSASPADARLGKIYPAGLVCRGPGGLKGRCKILPF